MSQTDPTWNGRIPADVKEYLQKKKGLSAGQCLVNYSKILKSQERPELLQEKENLLKRVAQIDLIVSQLDNESATKQAKCDTEKLNVVVRELKKAWKPQHFLGKSINGIIVTQELIDQVEQEKTQ